MLTLTETRFPLESHICSTKGKIRSTVIEILQANPVHGLSRLSLGNRVANALKLGQAQVQAGLVSIHRPGHSKRQGSWLQQSSSVKDWSLQQKDYVKLWFFGLLVPVIQVDPRSHQPQYQSLTIWNSKFQGVGVSWHEGTSKSSILDWDLPLETIQLLRYPGYGNPHL